MVKVSIVSPSYRHADFIGDCIRSVLAQTMQDWEMIIVDDGSDDGTADIAESFNDPRIIVLRQAHEGITGLGHLYATALSRAKSPLIAVLECDDMWPATKLEEEVPLFDDPSVVLAYGSAKLMDENGRVYARFWHSPRRKVARNNPVGSILPALVEVNFIVAATVIVRRSALDKIGGFTQPVGISYVDHPTWLLLATVGTFARSRRDLGFWRRYARQVTTRSWFDAPPDRASYLQDVVAEAQGIVASKVLTKLELQIGRDSSRQHEEVMIARGRVALIEGHWRQATALFMPLLRTGLLRNRAVGALGLLCASCRTDMEHAISALGRHSLPSRRYLVSHGEADLSP